jgi:hypothetical protein
MPEIDNTPGGERVSGDVDDQAVRDAVAEAGYAVRA